MAIPARLAQIPPGALFNARRPNISASLGFNMWKGSRAYRRLIASYFRPAGKTGKLTAQYIAGMKERDGRDRDRRASGRENKKQLIALTLLIVAIDGIRHRRRKLLPAIFPGKEKRKKNSRAHHRSSHLFAPHPDSSLPGRLLFPLHITISAMCSPGNNRFTGRIRAELALYTRRG